MNDIKKKNIIMTIAVLLVGLGIAGGTYAYLTQSITTTNNTYNVETHCFTIDYTGGTQEITGTLFPSGTVSKGLSGSVSMKVNDACNLAGKGTLTLHINGSTSSKLTTPASSYCEDRSTLEPIAGISTKANCDTAGGRWQGYGDSYCESNTNYERLTAYTDSSSCSSHGGTWTSGGSPLKYAVYANATGTGTPLSKGKITSSNIGSTVEIYNNFAIDRTQKYYYIFIWVDGYLTDATYVNLPFSGYITAEATQNESAAPLT